MAVHGKGVEDQRQNENTTADGIARPKVGGVFQVRLGQLIFLGDEKISLSSLDSSMQRCFD